MFSRGRTDVQWSKIRFSGSEPRVVGFSVTGVWYAGDAVGFGSWLLVERTWNATHFDDRHLPVFTTYQYRLTVYNEFAFTISPTSAPVATYGGVPTQPANLSAYALNHTAISLNWTVPCQLSSHFAVIAACSSKKS